MKTKTRSKVAEPLYDPQYPARQVLQIIADTWTPIVLFCMRGRTRRFNELQRSIPDISKKMLTQFSEAVALLCEWAVQNKALLKQVAARGTH
jgi:DNA-binding HxlR family transcriptional regulator